MLSINFAAKKNYMKGNAMSWISPLGLPIVQPYRKQAVQVVKTTIQTFSLSVEDDAMPVSRKKQRSAFPPNFVHSLDATHMLMTSLKMKERGLLFAPVHDSYWTHAADVPVMGRLLRECFVTMYSQPVLESLRDSLVIRYSDVEKPFPPVPKRGELDIKSVLGSSYFFH